ncbi:MAG: hypothetical protein ABSG46_13985, partial [Candidatus Binataceae bacterium]
MAQAPHNFSHNIIHDCGNSRSDGLDLGIGKRPAFEVFGLADSYTSIHDLIDEASLYLQQLP